MAKKRIDPYPGYQCLSVYVQHAHAGPRGRKHGNPAVGWVVGQGGKTLSPVFKQRWEAQAWAGERFLVAGWHPPATGAARDPYKHLYAVPAAPEPKKPVSAGRRQMELSVCLEPLEDTVRLAAADLCDEEGDHDRAEFIRHAVANPGESDRALAARGLNAQDMADWCEDVARCFDHENIDPNGRHGYQRTWGAFGINYERARRLGQFYGRDHGPTTWGWSRGYVGSLVTSWEDYVKACGEGLFLAAPITTMRLFGFAPVPAFARAGDTTPSAYVWYSTTAHPDPADRHVLPDALVPHLGVPTRVYAEEAGRSRLLVRNWETPDPYGLLSAALVDYGRARAGLPPIREQLFTGFVRQLS